MKCQRNDWAVGADAQGVAEPEKPDRVCGSRPGVSEDSDDSKVSLWLEQWLAQSWDSDNICWHEWDKGEKKKKEWLGKWRNYLLFNKVRWMAYRLSISYRIDQWNSPTGMTLHVALACLSSQIFPLPASYFVLSPEMLPGFTLIYQGVALSFHAPCTFPIKIMVRDFPGGPVAKTLCSQCRGSCDQSLVRELDPTCHS